MFSRKSTVLGAALAISVVSVTSPFTVPAIAAPCVFDVDTATMTVTSDRPVIQRVGDAIEVSGQACGEATVTAVDTIIFAGPDHPTIDLSGGPFAPGMTDEGDGSSEIEFENDWTVFNDGVLTIEGTTGSDHISMSSEVAPDRTRTLKVNLDASEAVLDSEFSYLPEVVVLLEIRARAGDDVIDGSGGGSDEPYTDIVQLLGGPGDDRYAAARNETVSESLFEGDGGIDVFDLSSVPLDEPVIIAIAPDGGGFAAGGQIVLTEIERVLGHAGEDRFYGRAGSQQLFGRGGDDLIRGGRDVDRLVGGEGADELVGGDGVDRCDVDPTDVRVFRCEREI